MEILIATDMGFCWGVRRAMGIMEKAVADGQRLKSLGPIVHNRQVMEQLATAGVQVVDSLEAVDGDRIAITAHGVGPQTRRSMDERGLDIVDTTCPIVRSAQRAAQKLAEAGFTVVIFGDADHREVKGVLGWAGESAIATRDWHDVARNGRFPRRIGLLSQTTESPERFARFASQFAAEHIDDFRELRVINTTCRSTTSQQRSAVALAEQVDLMLVIGSHTSANTRHLVEVCSEEGTEARHIETASDLQPEWFAGKERVGVTAGASTPDDVIAEVVARLREM